MNEEGWLTSTNPNDLGVFVHNERLSNRKSRLYALACCRRLPLQSVTTVCKRALALSERYADGEAVYRSLQQAAEAIHDLQRRRSSDPVEDYTLSAVAYVASFDSPWLPAAAEYAIRAIAAAAGEAVEDARYDEASSAAQLDEEFAQCKLLRDIFGNPFHPVAFAPEWRTDTALALARQMYESRDFSAMPILADALQDAGCDNADVLNHCRGESPHVRGCWVVDLLLGKE